MKRVLITGANSYIGTSFEEYAKEHYQDEFKIETVDMIDGSWRNKDFSGYDIVFHVAGIAHADVGKVTEEIKAKYYAVNTDLAIETANKAKADGVKQFVFMSSAIVYGDSAPYGHKKRISKITKPKPSNFYGDSKWQADKGVRKLADGQFTVTVLRPPMIYGKGSKGNYPTLAKMAKKLPVFPDIQNERSMLYIENLCDFLCQVMIRGEGGIFWPQNEEYSSTSEIVKYIAGATGHRIWISKMFSPCVAITSIIPGKISGLTNKAFGNLTYDQDMSRYDFDYQRLGLKESIKRTETDTIKKRILFLVNHEVVIYNFRLELVERLLADGYEVHISTPVGDRVDKLKKMGAFIHPISFDRHGMNPLDEIKILREYNRLMNGLRPLIVFGYTIKPNIYGAIASRICRVPFVANITGLGTAVENGGLKQKLTVMMYRGAFGTKKGRIQKVFFQNKENEQFFKEARIALDVHGILPGSGVNLERFPYRDMPVCGDGKTGEPVKFAFISRIMKEKGIDQYLDAAEAVKKEYPNTEFHICGFFETEYDRTRFMKLVDKGTVLFHGNIEDVGEFMSQMHCIIHPTYYPEGLSNVLLEACATGRPIITTDRAGCREVCQDDINGYLVRERNSQELIVAVKRFIELARYDKETMAKAARLLVKAKFSRQIIVNAYVDEVRRSKVLEEKVE